MRIGYVLKMFPRLSETFILNELLERQGRFHGRLAGLRLTATYFPRDKPESSWNTLCELHQGSAPSFDRWSERLFDLRKNAAVLRGLFEDSVSGNRIREAV